MSHRSRKGGLVYFIKPARMDGPIKIGHSWCPQDRLISLTAWSPWPLELIGAVKAESKDERFLHACFADCHSHREWFHSTPRLREAIFRIVEAETIDVIRDELKPIGSIRSPRKNSPTGSRRLSYRMRIYWVLRKLDLRDGPACYYRAPEEIERIMTRWHRDYRSGTDPQDPMPSEIEALELFIANPANAIRRERKLKVVA